MWLLSISEVGLPFETERTPLTFDRVEAELASSLPHLEGSSDGPQRRRDVRRRSALRQPIGGSGEIASSPRSEEHTSELQSRGHIVCRLLLEQKLSPRIPASCCVARA